ncbi:hypothetical protein [Acidicapsa acidisoli]|uniref:hypothetical protein n=1 Tax=Acidicapsa acidisoli TaxID=1615681 RepID=UPI0021E0D498|nr:hypothetical protein [Acidicapsa acidisoli]
MIALVTTFFLVFYILIPGALFRFATSFSSVKLKSFQRTRTQEATFAVAVAVFPFALALAGVWYLPVMRHHPFPIHEGTSAERRQDYRHVGEMLLTNDLARLAGCNPSAPCLATQTYWSSLDLVLRRQARFLSWFFLVTFAEGLAFGLFASKYGDWHSTAKNRHNPFARFYSWFTRKFVLPNISEWHVLLTGFNWPKGVLVVADVLQSDGHLYRGRVEDYFVDPDGKFTGILLRNVDRFDLYAYRHAQESAANPQTLASENYWKTIPSENFYIAQTAISNLNIRFAPGGDDKLEDVTRDVLSREAIEGRITIEEPESPTNGAPQSHPDIYS